jgi:hypothetical protein
MPNFDERTAIIAASGNYGIADYFRQVVEVLVKVWDIKNLKPDYPEAQDAMDRLNKHLERLARLAVLAERRKTGSSATIRAQAMKLLGWDEEEALVTAGGVLLNP